MFITTYSRANPNFKELISTHWSYLCRSSATRELGKQDFMITSRKLASLKDMLIMTRISQPTIPFSKGSNRPHICKYCGRISQSGHIKNLQNNKTYNKLRDGTCQSNNLTYCLDATGAILNMQVKPKTKSLIDSKVIFLTSNTLTTPQWQDTFTATKINWMQI